MEESRTTRWNSVRQQIVMLTGIERHDLIKAGLPTGIFRDALATYRDISEERLLQAVGLSARTLQRRAGSRLGPQHSDAAMALIEVTDLAEHVLGKRSLAERWLAQPAIALNGWCPVDLICSTPGIEAIKELLTRIEYGVYA
jgi:putative toxin-antitoxin system antitoxin component (TIGR02293 family)